MATAVAGWQLPPPSLHEELERCERECPGAAVDGAAGEDAEADGAPRVFVAHARAEVDAVVVAGGNVVVGEDQRFEDAAVARRSRARLQDPGEHVERVPP